MSKERWRLMEEFENIAENQPVFAGRVISHAGVKELVVAGLAAKDSRGDYVLTAGAGQRLWNLWKNVKSIK